MRQVISREHGTVIQSEDGLERCEMFDEIASGGMAAIHLGRLIGAEGFARTVAIKRLRPQFAHDPDFLDMFLDEARVVARIRHPNVIPTLNLVEEGDNLYIIMEYVEGINFSQLLRAAEKRDERAPVEVALQVVVGTLNGLHAAHEAKDENGELIQLVHRDVSPENVLVGVDGFSRVLDFGVMRALGRRAASTQDGVVKGKVTSMAPEHALGEPVDRRTDVFSASAMLWRALTGRRVFTAKSLGELTLQVLEMSIDPPSKLVPDLPRSLDQVVMRGLEREPAKRWPDAASMAEAIEAACRLAPHREVGRWVRRLGSRRLGELAALVTAMERRPVRGPSPGRRRVRQRSLMDLNEELRREAAEDAGYDLDAPPLPESARDLIEISVPPSLPPRLPASAETRPVSDRAEIEGAAQRDDAGDDEGDDIAAHVALVEDTHADDEEPARGATGAAGRKAARELAIEAQSPLSMALVERPRMLVFVLLLVTLAVAVGLVVLVLALR